MTDAETTPKQAYCGFLNVLKPPGMTSARVVGKVRWMLGGEKVGHAGTLDPEAAGVLPLMIGKAARLFDYMQDKEKAYITEVAFGSATDTQDAQGVQTAVGTCCVDRAAVEQILPVFTGQIMQTPPMFSALKRDGKRLYDLARQGETVALDSRPVTVHGLELIAMTERQGALLAVRCSKGFYVRTLCHDIGLALHCPAHMRFLLRTQSGVFTLDTAQTLEEMQAASDQGILAQALLPMDIAVAHLPMVEIPTRLERMFRNGIPIRIDALKGAENLAQEQSVRLLLRGGLIAIGQRVDDVVKQRTWLGE